MNKDLKIKSVYTLDSCVEEYTKSVKECYPKTEHYVNVHFSSPFNVGDIIRVNPDVFDKEHWDKYGYCGADIIKEKAFIKSNAELLSWDFIIDRIKLVINEKNECTAYAEFATGVNDEIVDNRNKGKITPWLKGANLKYFISSEYHEAHPFSFDTIFPYAIGTEYFNGPTIYHTKDSTFGWENNIIDGLCFNVEGYLLRKSTDTYFQINTMYFNLDILHFDWSLPNKGFHKNGWPGYIINKYYLRRGNNKVTTYTRCIFPVNELHEHITPDKYHHYVYKNTANSHDIEVTGYLLRLLGFDSIGEKYEAFKKIAEENYTEKIIKPKKPRKTNIHRKSKNVKDNEEVTKILENLSENQKALLLKMLTENKD